MGLLNPEEEHLPFDDRTQEEKQIDLNRMFSEAPRVDSEYEEAKYRFMHEVYGDDWQYDHGWTTGLWPLEWLDRIGFLDFEPGYENGAFEDLRPVYSLEHWRQRIIELYGVDIHEVPGGTLNDLMHTLVELGFFTENEESDEQ